MKHKLKFLLTLRPNQQEAVDQWLKRKGGILKAPPRSGKCSVGSSLINVKDVGQIKIQELFKDFTLDPENETIIEISDLEVVTRNGIKEVSHLYTKIVDETYKVTTESGYCYEATPNHPMWINGSWVQTSEIKEGDLISTCSAEHFTSNSLSNKLVQLLAKYVSSNRAYSDKVLLKIMRLNAETQNTFIQYLYGDSDEFYSDDHEVMRLLQNLLLNLGYLSRLDYE